MRCFWDKKLIFFLAAIFWLTSVGGILFADSVEIYSKVKVWVQTPADIRALQNQGVTIDHFHGDFKSGIDLVLNQREVALVAASGIPHEMLVADLSTAYAERPQPTPAEMTAYRALAEQQNVSGFDFGSMGGFYTFTEVEDVLDTMYANYPAIITQKMPIGLSIQNRTIWAVKISDNPDMDESATEAAVYYDALHHAREPASMAVTIYYMFWLLENYGIDPHATYLVDNREIFFVPVVNPDGYVYNQQTNPNGGGFWRKNRRNNGGCYGVDLNRNYSFGFNTGGASNDPCNDTYHGGTPFSEPETDAVRIFLQSVNPSIAFTTHSVRGAYLNPYGYTSISPEFEIYSEFSSDFAAKNQYLYGRTNEILSYTSSGTTRDYFHSEGIYGWTPEIDGSGFWPAISEIMPLVMENVYPMKYLSWVSGAYTDFQNFEAPGDGYAEAGDTLSFIITVKNRGLTQTAQNVMVHVSTNHPNVMPVVASANYDSVAARTEKANLNQPFRFAFDHSAPFLDDVFFHIAISQDGVETMRDTVAFTIGKQDIIYFDDAETGKDGWLPTGFGLNWDTTFVDHYRGTHSFADSRYGNSQNNTDNVMFLFPRFNLTEATNPRLEFWAKWAIERNFDYVRLQISINNGATWQSLATEHTTPVSGQPGFTGLKHWVQNRVDLSSYAGARVKFRFTMETDGGTIGDGFYFDDFKLVDYTETPVGISENDVALPKKFALHPNFPNPFNPETMIRYDVPSHLSGEVVLLTIYNALGQKVRTLVSRVEGAGHKTVQWNGKNDKNLPVSSGIYLYKLQINQQILSRKLLLIR